MKINTQIVFTVVILFLVIIVFDFTSIDVWFQDYLFRFDTKQWVLDRDQPITKLLLYDGIKRVFIVFVVMLALARLFFKSSNWIQNYKRGILSVCLSAILIPTVVSLLKYTTNVACPKSLVRYGGNYPYVRLTEHYPENASPPHRLKCFPAGHASGGFPLMSLYFLLNRKPNRKAALASIICVSWIIGGYKMAIGDHFLSHTLVTILLSWLIILLVVSGVNRVEARCSKHDLVKSH